MDKNIKMVKDGYEFAAEHYLKQKNGLQHQIPVFQTWLTKCLNTVTKSGVLLELGCASGFPIAAEIISRISSYPNFNYIGIDLASKQIELAKSQYSDHKDSFIEAEMLEYLKSLGNGSVLGIVSMFAIRHVPRKYHVELFEEIFRVLDPKGYFLIDCPLNSDDGWIEENWMGAPKMYWSTFSREWTELTLKEIGFNYIEIAEDKKEFDGEIETTVFFLLNK